MERVLLFVICFLLFVRHSRVQNGRATAAFPQRNVCFGGMAGASITSTRYIYASTPNELHVYSLRRRVYDAARGHSTSAQASST